MNVKDKKTILLVDDEVIIAITEKTALEQYGYGVITALSGEEAIATIEKTPAIDLVLMDVNLGAGMDGTEAAAIILRQRDIPVVFLSSHMEPEVVAKTEKITSYGYVVKDSSITVLDASIKMAFKLFHAKINENKKEEELKKRNRYIESILDNMPIGFAVNTIDDGVARYLNDNFTKIYGWPKEVLTDVDQFFEKIYPGDYGRELKARVIRDMGSGDPKRMAWDDLRITTSTGEHRYISARNIPILEQNLMVSTVWDTTRMHESLEALRDAEARYRLLYEQSPDGIVFIEPATARILEFNETAHKQLGYSREEFARLSIPDIEAVETLEETQARISSVIENGASDFETRQRTKQGEIRNIRVIAQFTEVQGRPIYHCIWRDITELEQAQAALKASETRAQALLSAIPDMLFRVNRQGIFLDYKADIKDLYFQSEPGIIGKRYHDILPAEFTDLFDRKIRATLETGSPLVFEYQMPVPGRGRRDYEARMVASGANEVTAIVRDITKRKQAEEDLRQSEAKLSNALQMTKSGHWEYDVDRDLFTFNDNFYCIFRTTAAAVGGYQMASEDYARRFCHPEDMAKVGIETRAAIEATDPNYSRQIEHRILYADGEVGWIAVRFFIAKDPQGRTVKTYGVNQDISDRKRAEQDLRQSEERYRSILNASPDGIGITDMEGRILIVSPSVLSMVGCKREEEVLGRLFTDFVSLDDRNRASSDVERMSQKAMMGLGEYHGLRADGSAIDLEVNGEFIMGADGPPMQMVFIIRDIAERKRVEGEIKRQLAEKEILLKEVHHRIKNNFASVSGLLSLQARALDDPKASAVLQDAIGRVDSMRILYDKLLLSDDYKDIPVKNYVGSLADAVVSLFPEQAKVSLDQEIAGFQLDPKRLFPLGIIINELLTNVMKHAFTGKKRGRIRLSLNKEGRRVTLSIQDNGVGLPAGFDIEQSKGFGLLLVKMLSQQLGGNFAMETRKGTRCTLEFDV